MNPDDEKAMEAGEAIDRNVEAALAAVRSYCDGLITSGRFSAYEMAEACDRLWAERYFNQAKGQA